MPRIQANRQDLIGEGPAVELTLVRPADVVVPSGPRYVDSMPVMGIIDTGADICAIHQDHADELGLQRIDDKQLRNSTGLHRFPIYLVDVVFKEVRATHEAAGCTFGGQPIDFLLGREFLAGARLIYDGPNSSYELELPD